MFEEAPCPGPAHLREAKLGIATARLVPEARREASGSTSRRAPERAGAGGLSVDGGRRDGVVGHRSGGAGSGSLGRFAASARLIPP